MLWGPSDKSLGYCQSSLAGRALRSQAVLLIIPNEPPEEPFGSRRAKKR